MYSVIFSKAIRRPLFIRAAHGQKQFLEMPIIKG
ncbi:uncharacterized protein METZ01_LOCUS378478, partial [marine metagenome]